MAQQHDTAPISLADVRARRATAPTPTAAPRGVPATARQPEPEEMPALFQIISSVHTRLLNSWAPELKAQLRAEILAELRAELGLNGGKSR